MGVFLRRLAILVLVGCQAFSQTAKRVCPAAGTIALTVALRDSYDSAALTYQISRPKASSTAQIEVWDRPKLLFRTQVPVQGRGQIIWTPKEEPADTPLALWIGIDDSQFPIDGPESTAAMLGTTGPVEGGPVPELVTQQSTVIEEGGQSPTVLLKGQNLGERNTRILLFEEESPQVWIAREYLPTALADLEHISVEIPSGYLLKPTVLALAAVRVGDESLNKLGTTQGNIGWQSATIHVVSKDRPVFSRVEPSQLSASWGDQGGVPLRIFGGGFTNESQVLPRELWRHHQLSFRLVTQTSRGTCPVEVLEEE